jgi:site-specific recombinase XerD
MSGEENSHADYQDKVKSILTGRKDLLDFETSLKEKSSQNRIERTDIGRRMRELEKKRLERKQKTESFGREISAIRKENMVGHKTPL